MPSKEVGFWIHIVYGQKQGESFASDERLEALKTSDIGKNSVFNRFRAAMSTPQGNALVAMSE